MIHNQVQLAEYLCVTRPALSKEINKLYKEGYIRISGKDVHYWRGSELKQLLV